MNNHLTEIAYILDRSGSMSGLEEAAIAGFNQFLADQKAAPGDARLSLVLFDNEHLVPCNRVPIAEAPELITRTYVPRGSTALLDSIGITIDAIGRRLAALPERDRPGHVVIAIFTDGYENASTRYTLRDIEKRITHQREKYHWEFLFLAANQDAIATAATMGIAATAAATSDTSPDGLRKSSAAFSRSIRQSREMLQERGHIDYDAKPSLREEYEQE